MNLPRYLALSTFWLALASGTLADTPKVTVSDVRLAFDDGHHNAFTDLAVFDGRFFLAFRSCPDGHGVSPNASIVILSSPDAETWTESHRFSVPGRDTRDPHFLVFDNKLFVYTGTWHSGTAPAAHQDLDLNLHLGFASTTTDGQTWSAPQMLEGTFGHYIWRAATYGGKAYLCGRRKIGFAVGPHGEPREVESLLLESVDGLTWNRRATFQTVAGDETAFLFERDGSILAIGRRGSDHAQLLRSKPPYEDWQRSALDRYIGGPLVTRWGGRTVVGGRRQTPDGPRTSLCWLDGDKLSEFAQLLSAGDNSYPGFVAITPTTALVSWYSSHDNNNASIYLAKLTIGDGTSSEQPPDVAEADHILARQRTNGGWSKSNPGGTALELLFARDRTDTTFDNGCTHRELRQLARAYTRGGKPRFRHGCIAGLDFILAAQNPNGGWPQRYPDNHGYARHITFNDGAMVGVLEVLDAVASGEEPFAWCDESLRNRARSALGRGIACILDCQVRSHGVLTAWAQQHDNRDFSPQPAWTFEPAALCSSASAQIVRLLIGQQPTPEISTAINAAVTWLRGPAKLTGIRQGRDPEHGRFIVDDPSAGPLWARFYEIGTNRPVFGDRDGQVYYNLSEISAERRNGYRWYTDSPRELLERDYPSWKSRQR